jgi:CO dehydrogenase maturation factor
MERDTGFKVVITGKGGVGKTTLTACLARLLNEKGLNILAADEDPQMNLPYALGLPVTEAARIVPLNQHHDYIEEKTGVRPGKSFGALFRLNPRVEDVVARFGVQIATNLNLLVMGTVVQAATGCLCAENVLLDSVIRHLSLRENEAVLLDTQAGMEHFGRAIAKGFSQCLVVSDNSFNALAVASHSARLARQIGIPSVRLVINRIDSGGNHRLDRFDTMTGADTAALFDSIHVLADEPRFEELEPDVTRILKENSHYVEGLSTLADEMLAFEQDRCHQQKSAGERQI